MKNRSYLLVLLSVAALTFFSGHASAQQKKTIILVRHAEKSATGSAADMAKGDPDLSPEGHERAERFARAVKKYRPQEIFSTDYKRTRQTAEPIAKLRKKEVQTYDPAKQADLAEKILTSKTERFVIVGHSYGGAVVAAYAAAHPERVAGVVYADSAGTINMPAAAAENFVAALKRDRDAVVSQWFGPMLMNAAPPVKSEVLDSVQSTPLDAFTGALVGLRDVDVAAAARAYHGPRLIIAAGPGNPSSLRTQVPEIPVREMTGVSHWLMMDKPGEFNALLDAFLAGVR